VYQVKTNQGAKITPFATPAGTSNFSFFCPRICTGKRMALFWPVHFHYIVKLTTIILSGIFAFWVPGSNGLVPVMSISRVAHPDVPLTIPETNPLDISIFEEKRALAAEEQTLAAQTLAVARSFLGTPYVHGTLEGEVEQPVINLRELDCWTFVENSLAIALAARATDPTYDTLQQLVQHLRYWGGAVKGYASRIHYFTGWVLQAEKLGHLQDITRELGGVPYRNKIGYMTARPNKYPALRDGQTWRAMKAVEDRLNSHTWFYIPQNRVARIEHLLRDGDIIALTSWKKGLDIAHQGFAVKKNGRIYLLHASSLGKRVVLSAQPLAQYLLSQKGQTGIIVARINS